MRLAALVLALALAGCSTIKPAVSVLPQLELYDGKNGHMSIEAINAERPKVQACCPNTFKAMHHYGTLRAEIQAVQKPK